MPNTIAVLHTSPASIDLFKQLIAAARPGTVVFNYLDDSILPQLNANGGDLASVRARWTVLAGMARDQGAEIILNACSSIGELCAPVSAEIGLPIVRVDSAMAEHVVSRFGRVGVIATLKSTLQPTGRVLTETAERLGKKVEIVPVPADGAYAAIMAGDAARHDAMVRDAIAALGEKVDAIVLAQASMARVRPLLPPEVAAKIMISPDLAVQDLLRRLSQ